jgi:hypothetical protein
MNRDGPIRPHVTRANIAYQETTMTLRTRVALAVATLLASAAVSAAAPAVVKGPGDSPACFKPWNETTKHFQWPAKKGPYRIALANGFVGNTWRIQMIKMAKAYAATPEMKGNIKEFKIVSTGTDVAAQIAAIDNFINSGYDAIITIAVNPTAFGPVIKRANAAGVVLVPFDNVLDSEEIMQVNEDQTCPARPASCSRCVACPATRSTGIATSAFARWSRHPAASSRSSRWSATGTTAPRRRWWPTPWPCTRSSTA